MTDLLVVAGEASGDKAAAAVLDKLGGVRAFGMGGAAIADTGAEVLFDLRETTALGVDELAFRACAIALAFEGLVRASRKRKPKAALLVNYTEFNIRLAAFLHRNGVRVLWYGAPQIWAWRPGRANTLRKYVDRMAVVLPFEENLWRKQGMDALYVGHPSREIELLDRKAARGALGLTPFAACVAILPGSRPHEVERLLSPMLEAYEKLRDERASVDGRVMLAPSLDSKSRARALQMADAANVPTVEISARAGAAPYMRAFDVALCASGTAALESVLAHAVPVVAYRVGLVSELVARRQLRTPYISLPNVLLGRAAFAEITQRDVTPHNLTTALVKALDERSNYLLACSEVEASLGAERTPSERVARLLSPWL